MGKLILILSNERTGSTLLCHALQRVLPNTLSFDEIFTNVVKCTLWPRHGHMPYYNKQQLMINDAFFIYLEHVQKLVQQHAKDIIIKVHREHVAFNQTAWHKLFTMSDKIIFLTRENDFHRYVSWRVASKLNQWWLDRDSSSEPITTTISIDVYDMLANAMWIQNINTYVRKLLWAVSNVFSITYNQIVNNVTNISTYLNPQQLPQKLVLTGKKILAEPYQQIITNYRQVYELLTEHNIFYKKFLTPP